MDPLTTTVDEPAGTHVILETRSGATPTPDSSWSAYQPLGANNAIESPLGRYLQYRAKLSTTDAQVTPSLDDVQLDYTAPSTSITDVEVSEHDGHGLVLEPRVGRRPLRVPR